MVQNEVATGVADVVVGSDKLIISYVILSAIEQLYRSLGKEVLADELKGTYLDRVYDGEKVTKFRCDLYEDDLYKPISVKIAYSHISGIIENLDSDNKIEKLKELEKALLRSFFVWVETDSIMEANRISVDSEIFR